MVFRLTFDRGRADLLGRLSRHRWRREFEGPCAGIAGTLVVDDERALLVGVRPALAAAAGTAAAWDTARFRRVSNRFVVASASLMML
jgi:hypothetical protein